MGWLTDLGRVAGRVVGATVRAAAPVIPGASVALSAIDIGSRVFGGGSASPGLPQLPALPNYGTQPGGGGALATQAATRGSYAMPSLTIDLIRQLEAAGLMVGYSKLRACYRSPVKGMVVVHPRQPDGSVATFALNKKLARQWGLWKAAAKPPISAGDWNAIQRANAVVKKIRGMNSEIKKVANFGNRAIHPTYRVVEQPGRKMIARTK